ADHRFLGSTTPLVESQRVAAFMQRLRELGWIESRTIAVEYRWAEGRRSFHWKSGEAKTSCPPSKRSKAARRHFMPLSTRSSIPPAVASMPGRWARDCRPCTPFGKGSKWEV